MVSPPFNVLREVQKFFCLVNLSGELRVADRRKIAIALSANEVIEVFFHKKADGEVLIKRYLETLLVDSDVRKIVVDFWVDPNTHIYDAIDFSPLQVPSTTLNYWRGHTIEPVVGCWKDLSGFLLDVICDADEKVYEYLICYLAHMLQRPEEKPGIMLVMLGSQGCGKGTFFTMIRKIWAQTALQINDIEQVLGRFNAILERNYAILMDEALFSGDKKASEKLKNIITESRIPIEQKYQPSRTINSCHRFFAASNNEHFAKVDKDDRRFLFLRVSNKYQNNFAYFEVLHNEIASGKQLAALVHDLLAMDIGTFNVRVRPKTQEHLSQKLQSLEGFDRYWHEVLQSGEFCSYNWPQCIIRWETPIFLSTQSLLEDYKKFNRNAERYSPVQTNNISKALQKSCPSAIATRTTISNRQERGYDLPSIQTARREFEVYIGSKLLWAVDQEQPKKTYYIEEQIQVMNESYGIESKICD